MKEGEVAAEFFHLKLQRDEIERRMDELSATLKEHTGEREAGAYWVAVSSTTRETVDTDACRKILGDKTPVRLSQQVRLSVKPLPEAIAR